MNLGVWKLIMKCMEEKEALLKLVKIKMEKILNFIRGLVKIKIYSVSLISQ